MFAIFFCYSTPIPTPITNLPAKHADYGYSPLNFMKRVLSSGRLMVVDDDDDECSYNYVFYSIAKL